MDTNSTKVKVGYKLYKKGRDTKYTKVEKNFRRVTDQKSIKAITPNTPFGRNFLRVTPFLRATPPVTSLKDARDVRRDAPRDVRRDASRDVRRGVTDHKSSGRLKNFITKNSSLNPLHPAHPLHLSGVKGVRDILKKRKTGIVSITATGNNTLLTLSDGRGRLRGSVSAGSVGFRNSGKSALAGAEKAAARLIQKAREAGFLLLRVEMRGLGFTKLKALRVIVHSPLPILDIIEKTTRSHNGCRLPRKRRL
jgi:small subunit ribosomal protein S11